MDAEAAAARTETVEAAEAGLELPNTGETKLGGATDSRGPDGVEGAESRAKKLAAASTPKSLAGAEVLPGRERSGGKADELDEGAEESDPEGWRRPAGPCEAEGVGEGSDILQKQEKKRQDARARALAINL